MSGIPGVVPTPNKNQNVKIHRSERQFKILWVKTHGARKKCFMLPIAFLLKWKRTSFCLFCYDYKVRYNCCTILFPRSSLWFPIGLPVTMQMPPANMLLVCAKQKHYYDIIVICYCCTMHIIHFCQIHFKIDLPSETSFSLLVPKWSLSDVFTTWTLPPSVHVVICASVLAEFLWPVFAHRTHQF